MGKITRRLFIGTGAVAVTGLVVGAGYLSTLDIKGLKSAGASNGANRLNAWIEILADNSVRLLVPRAEMGQGAHMGVATLIAEELDVPLSRITVANTTELLPAYINTVLAVGKRPDEMRGPMDWTMQRVFSTFPFIATGGSSTLPDAWLPMRLAGATARAMIVSAAAQKWNVSVAELTTADGFVTHAASKRQASYGELAADAAKLPAPDAPALKPASAFKLIGKENQQRVDLPAKVNGTAVFGVDVKLPGMLIGTLVQAPRLGATIASVDDSAAKNMPGVVKIIRKEKYVAVVGKSYWFAKAAADALKITWAGGEKISSADVTKALDVGIASGKAHDFRKDGDSATQFAAATNVVEARYEVPYLAHVCMEPMNATAWLKADGSLEVWAPIQSPVAMKFAAQAALGSAPEVAVYHTTYLGGGFGRRGERDYVERAIEVAQEVKGQPVKLIWSREEDMTHDMFRPAAVAKMRGLVGVDKKIAALDADVALQSVAFAFSKRALPYSENADKDFMNAEGLASLPYALPDIRVTGHAIELPVPVGNWRSVGSSQNGFFAESFVDELAHNAKADPLEFRIAHVQNNAKFLAVLQKLKEVSGWGNPLSENQGRGVSIVESFNSIVGEVAEVTVNKDGALKVNRVHCVVDCGVAVNPDVVRAQIQSGVIYGLSAALYGKTSFVNSAVEQTNFDTQEVTRLATAPDITVHIMPSSQAPGGIGEPGTPPIFAAVTNAIYAVTGKRIRTLPISDHDLSWS
jgi:isoquinoline 1-oxidoreductase subunit beta